MSAPTLPPVPQPTNGAAPPNPPSVSPGTLTTADPGRMAVRYRRGGPLVIVLAILAVVVGSLGFGYLYTVKGTSVGVVAVRAAVPRGSVIERGDLVEAQQDPDPNVATVPWSQVDSVAGRRTAVDLLANSLVSPQAITDAVIPATGQALVGVALTRAQLPGKALQAGDRVRIVFTPRNQDPAPTAPPTVVVPAVVVNPPVAVEDSAQVVVDVTVNQDAASTLAAIVATGRISLVLDGTT